MRIARYLARCGVTSRRKAEELVLAGKVSVNGAPTTALHQQIDPEKDVVLLGGRPLRLAKTVLTIAMNKSAKVVVTRTDPQGRRTVYEALPEEFVPRASELVYAGRLDYETTGLLVLSTDGTLVQRLTHPRQTITKTYLARLHRPLVGEEIHRLSQGILLDGIATLPAKVANVAPRHYTIQIIEGRNRQIRRMLEAVGARTISLSRIAIGGLRLEDLSLGDGECRALEQEEIERLFRKPKAHE